MLVLSINYVNDPRYLLFKVCVSNLSHVGAKIYGCLYRIISQLLETLLVNSFVRQTGSYFLIKGYLITLYCMISSQILELLLDSPMLLEQVLMRGHMLTNSIVSQAKVLV